MDEENDDSSDVEMIVDQQEEEEQEVSGVPEEEVREMFQPITLPQTQTSWTDSDSPYEILTESRPATTDRHFSAHSTALSLSAIVCGHLNTPGEWYSFDSMDRIVPDGVELYRRSIQKFHEKRDGEFVCVQELETPSVLLDREVSVKCLYRSPIFDNTNLRANLAKLFSHTDYGIMSSRSASTSVARAVIQRAGRYYLSDTQHFRVRTSDLSDSPTVRIVVMLQVNSLDKLTDLLNQLYRTDTIGEHDSYYTLDPIKCTFPDMDYLEDDDFTDADFGLQVLNVITVDPLTDYPETDDDDDEKTIIMEGSFGTTNIEEEVNNDGQKEDNGTDNAIQLVAAIDLTKFYCGEDNANKEADNGTNDDNNVQESDKSKDNPANDQNKSDDNVTNKFANYRPTPYKFFTSRSRHQNTSPLVNDESIWDLSPSPSSTATTSKVAMTPSSSFRTSTCGPTLRSTSSRLLKLSAAVIEYLIWTYLEDESAIINGSKNQGSGDFNHPGVQCVAMCAAAIVRSYLIRLDNWNRDAFDPILVEGDRLYGQSWALNGDKTATKPGYIFTKQLKRRSTLFEVETVISYVETDPPLYGARFDQSSLLAHLTFLFSKCNHGIVIAGQKARAVIQQGSLFYLFDSHSINPLGESVPGDQGRASIFSFFTVEKLTEKLFKIMNSGYLSQVEVVTIDDDDDDDGEKKPDLDAEQFTIDPIRVRFPKKTELDDTEHQEDLDLPVYEEYIRVFFERRGNEQTLHQGNQMMNPAGDPVLGTGGGAEGGPVRDTEHGLEGGSEGDPERGLERGPERGPEGSSVREAERDQERAPKRYFNYATEWRSKEDSIDVEEDVLDLLPGPNRESNTSNRTGRKRKLDEKKPSNLPLFDD